MTILDLPKAHVLPYLEDLGGMSCTEHSNTKHSNLISKPGNHMEISNHTHSKGVWEGNTIPMAWSTFWVHIIEEFLGKPNRSM